MLFVRVMVTSVMPYSMLVRVQVRTKLREERRMPKNTTYFSKIKTNEKFPTSFRGIENHHFENVLSQIATKILVCIAEHGHF